MIQLKNISLSYGDQKIFDNITQPFYEGQRVGLIGRNGAGKSTLLKVISGHIKPDEGSIAFEKDKVIAYMPQEVVLNSEKSVFDETFTVFAHMIDLENKKAQLEELLENSQNENAAKHLEEYTNIIETLSNFDKAQAIHKTEKILTGLGFNEIRKNQIVSTLSVGWKMRVVLAKLLLQEADFYLFDEPTNHLDLSTKEWFFNFLKESNCGFLLVSHDRHYLEKACEHTFELERGIGTMYDGNFSDYIKQKEAKRVMLEGSYNRQQKEIAKKQATIDRFRASASKAKMAQSMIKQLDKMELIEIEPTLPIVKFSFAPVERPGNIVLSTKAVQHSFDNKLLFSNANCEIQRGEKVALIAPNGTGKTTFYNIVTGKYQLQSGSINFGHNVTYAFFEQDQTKILKPKNTVLQEVLDDCTHVTESTIRGFLGSFLFTGDDVYKKINMLSGGERNRVAMVKVLLKKANFLLLDEPTNHLDIYAKEVLLQALLEYKGTILIVSHDHDFINKISTKILELNSDGLWSFHGNYDAYLDHKKHLEAKNQGSKAQDNTKNIKDLNSVSKDPNEIRKSINSLESKIAKLESEIQKINMSFADFEYGTKEFENASILLEEKQEALKQAIAQWESLLSK